MDEEYKSIYSNQSISSILVDAEGTGNKQHVCMYSFFEVLNWYKKFNLGIPDWHMHPNDHLVYELQYLISLLYHDNNPDALEHIAIFLDEHLLLWLGSFSKQIRDNSKAPFYTGIISLTAAYCEELRDIIAELLEQPRPTRKEIEQRMKFGHEKTKEITIQFVPSITPAI
ncbi:MAG: molecular chaperone TorD family protein [gamma proteobacterium symbiont of Lucinoma myriamae]|nr:molecular chaperone TorD family protein [gamma proteobacterium symbiont of Lucinoma myriamae]